MGDLGRARGFLAKEEGCLVAKWFFEVVGGKLPFGDVAKNTFLDLFDLDLCSKNTRFADRTIFFNKEFNGDHTAFWGQLFRSFVAKVAWL